MQKNNGETLKKARKWKHEYVYDTRYEKVNI